MWIKSNISDHAKNSKYIKDLFIASSGYNSGTSTTFRIMAFESEDDVNNHIIASFSDLDEAQAAFNTLLKELGQEEKVFEFKNSFTAVVGENCD